ncbi:hypothetical protein [Nocardioides sp.]|uniref:hypothetical protein n=1 Tax=Nocardioides sp. TaxID=35761 RepID=UPI002BC0B97D|nr:hypothetical protein [Nocardioides sp.]HSX68661.1 hypothetical protein [Nocardioides sp.]
MASTRAIAARLVATATTSYAKGGTAPLRMEALSAVNEAGRGGTVALVAQLAWIAGQVLASLEPAARDEVLAQFDDPAGEIRRRLKPEQE